MRIPTDELEKEYQEKYEQELTETQATEEEIQEMQSMRYVEDSPQVTGFQSSQEQFNQYEIITNIIGLNTSVLDFGCGRGDYFGWHASRYGQGKLNYIGIDANKVLTEAGKKLYDTIVLLNKDWTQLDDNVQNDWCININSNNLRYDLTSKSDTEYLFETIEAMYKHARVGILLSLSSSMYKDENGFIKHNPGDILNWAQEKYGSVAIDHSSSNKEFYLIIYKNEN
jgi:SAM-dependent methyltransferase